MKKRVFLLIVFFLLAGCSNSSLANQKTNERVIQNPSPVEDSDSNESSDQSVLQDIPDRYSENSIEQASISDQIHFLNLDINQFEVVSSEQVDWPDTCLGIDQPGINCVDETTPGYWVTLEANGLQFKVHADKKGNQILPATPGISWTRDGGLENYCDRLIIYLPDTVHACWCQSGEMKSRSLNLLEVISIDEYDWLIATLRYSSEFTVNQTPSSDSEPAQISLTIYGQGENKPSSGYQQSILNFAQDVFFRMIPQSGSQN